MRDRHHIILDTDPEMRYDLFGWTFSTL